MNNFIKRYIKAFSTKNTLKIIPYYTFPLIIIDKSILNNNSCLIIKNKKELKKYFDQLFKILKYVYKYKKTKILKIHFSKESEKNFCLIELTAARINIENKCFKKIKLSYFLRKIKKKYSIGCFIVES